MPTQFHVTTSLKTIKGDDVSMQVPHSDVTIITNNAINTQAGIYEHDDMSFITNNILNDFFSVITSADVEETTIQS